jgi:hypothetical protein
MTAQLLQAFDIGEILEAAGRALVLHEGVTTDQVDGYVAKRLADARQPGFRKGQPRQLGQNVDPTWRHADLVHSAGLGEVGDRQFLGRRAKVRERAHDSGRVVCRGFDPDVEVAGGASSAVRRQRIRANYQEPDVSVDEVRNRSTKSGFIRLTAKRPRLLTQCPRQTQALCARKVPPILEFVPVGDCV